MQVLRIFSEAKESRMFRDLPADLLKELASEPLTANAHKWSLATSVRRFSLVSHSAESERSRNVDILLFFQAYESNAELKNFYKVLSTNSDGTLEFVSTIEGESATRRVRRRVLVS